MSVVFSEAWIAQLPAMGLMALVALAVLTLLAGGRLVAVAQAEGSEGGRQPKYAPLPIAWLVATADRRPWPSEPVLATRRAPRAPPAAVRPGLIQPPPGRASTPPWIRTADLRPDRH